MNEKVKKEQEGEEVIEKRGTDTGGWGTTGKEGGRKKEREGEGASPFIYHGFRYVGLDINDEANDVRLTRFFHCPDC